MLPACSFLSTSCRPPRAPPEEAARVKFPLAMYTRERVVLSGGRVTAMELALDDFLSLDAKPHKGADTTELCLYQRESYDVIASPGPEGLTWVTVTLRPGLCEEHGLVMDMEASYAIDASRKRLVAVLND